MSLSGQVFGSLPFFSLLKKGPPFEVKCQQRSFLFFGRDPLEAWGTERMRAGVAFRHLRLSFLGLL